MKTLFFLLLSVAVYSQCPDVQKNEIDEFTGSHIAVVGKMSGLSYTLVSNKCKNCTPNIGFMGFMKTGDDYNMWLRVHTNSPYAVNKDTECIVLLDNGEKITYKALATAISDVRPDDGGMSYSTLMNFAITKHDLHIFSEDAIDKIRFETSEGYRVIRCKKQKRVMEYASCLLNL